MAEDNNRLNQRIAALAAVRPLTSAVPPALRRQMDIRCDRRDAAYRLGHLQLSDRSMVCCIIKDMSENGARITLESALALPEMTVLRIDYSGERRRARVAWQRDREAGLSFAVEPAIASLKKCRRR